MKRLFLGIAIAILAVTFVGKAVDALSERTVEVLVVVGFGFLAVGQALRAWEDRSRRSLLTLLLVLALGAFVILH